ncbi:PAS domain-containing sensor histidine kinase [Patescibacteria group bacterium]|nr:PAS domain-containing sensor histidine kinase [Patescibacteria group bacterium]
MEIPETQLQYEIDRSFDRSLLLAVLGFLTTVIFSVFFPFSEGGTAYWCFVLGSVITVLSSILVYERRTSEPRRVLAAAAMAESTIRSSRDLFTEMYHRSPVPYVLIDETGTIESCNIAAVRLFKVTEESLNHRDVFSLIRSAHPEHLDVIRERFQRGVALSAEEFEVPHEDGTSAWVLLSLFHFIDVRQRTLGLMTLVDITKQKEIDAAKTEFVSLASHQLRTPIAGMRWNTELLMFDTGYPLPEEQRHKAERLMQSINRLSSLVDDFLRVSRFELGELTPQVGRIDVRLFIEGIVSEQQSSAAEKQLVLEVPDGAQLNYEVRVDAALLGMIVTNFLVNAIKYTPIAGTIKMGVRFEGETLSVTVSDNGIGIPVAEQRHLFTKMFRASNAEKMVTTGTGLGLYIAKRAAEVLGGRVAFTSGEGVGSAFTVIVPVEMVPDRP